MRKLLSLVLAFAMILGLFAFPVSADATTYQQVGQELQALKVLKGVNAAGDLAELEKLTREQALVVLSRLVGQEEAALATDAQPGFADVPAAHWYSPYVAYAKAQGWTTGVSETEFGLGQSVTTKQALTFMMRALGYTADWSKEDIMKKAQELGLMEGVSAVADDAIIRGELFIIMKNTLYTKPMGEKIELIYKLGLAENPVPATLEVVDVKADNLKEVVVEFNQEVDKDTLKDAFKFVGSSHGTLTAKLQEDGKTVVVAIGDKLTNKKTYKLQVSKVKTLSGLTVEKVVKEFKVDDNQVPTVESVVVTGPKNLQLTFSEPVTAGTVKVALATGKSYSVATAKVDVSNPRKVNVVTFALKDGSTYKALVQKFEDFAGYKNIDAEIEFEYAKVTNAPTVEVVSATQEYVELKFDRPVKGLTYKHFYHTYSAWTPVALYKSVDDMNKALAGEKVDQISQNDLVDRAVVRFIGKVEDFKPESTSLHPLQVGEVEFNILGKVGSTKIQDSWNNQLQDTELKVTVTADKTAPVVESVEVSGEKEIEVTFSKKVLKNKDNYELLKEDGGKLTGTSISDVKVDGTTIKLVLSNNKLVGKTVLLNIKNVRDNTINQNKMVGTESFTITFGDKSFSGIKEAAFYKVDGDVVRVRLIFKEAVDSEKATTTKNYKIVKAGEVVSVDFEASMVDDKIVEFIFSKEDWTKPDKLGQPQNTPFYTADSLKVIMSNEVTDVAGNKISSFQQEVKVIGGATAPTVKSTVAENRSEIKLTFNEPVEIEGGFAASQFEVVANNGAEISKYKVSDVTHDEKVITITLLEDKEKNFELLAYDVLDNTQNPLKLKFTSTKKITNVAGGEMTWVDQKIDDSIKPAVMLLPEAVNSNDIAADPVYGTGQDFEIVVPAEPAETLTKRLTEAYNNLDLTQVKAVLKLVGNEYKLDVYFTENIDLQSLANNTFTVKADNENITWKIKDRPAVTDNVVTITFEEPSADELKNGRAFKDLKLTQNSPLKDSEGNTYKFEEEFKIQFVHKSAVESVEKSAAKAKLQALYDEAKAKNVKNGEALTGATTLVEFDSTALYVKAAVEAAFTPKLTAAKNTLDANMSATALSEYTTKHDELKAELDKVNKDENKVAVEVAPAIDDTHIVFAEGTNSGDTKPTTLNTTDGTYKYFDEADFTDKVAIKGTALAGGTDLTINTDFQPTTTKIYVVKFDSANKVIAAKEYTVPKKQ